MSLISEFSEYVDAAFAGIWIQTHEDTVLLATLSRFCQERRYLFVLYDISEDVSGSVELCGNKDLGREPSQFYTSRFAEWRKLPGAFLRDVPRMLGEVNKELGYQLSPETGEWIPLSPDRTPEHPALTMLIVVLRNGHFAPLVPPIGHVQLLQNLMNQGKSEDFRIVVTSHKICIPEELERYFVVLNHDLPTKEDLRVIACQVGEEAEQPQSTDDWDRLLEAASGLTTYEAENSYALSVIRKQKLEPATVWEVKSQTVKKRGLLEIYNGTDTFETLGGMQNFKTFCTGMLTKVQSNPLAKPRGILLTGVPGAGKSQGVKCLGNTVGRKVLILDMAALRSKYQGESENNLRDALKIADSMEPCILMCDEVEKALAGAGGGGENDGGVTDRVFGHFLGWLQDHTSDVFVCCTSNNISALPPEFTRAERFDGMFFFDLPSAAERLAIWRIYLKMFFNDPQSPRLKEYVGLSAGWTPAEIKTCNRLACMLEMEIPEASKLVSKISETARERLVTLRKWAEGKCLSTDKPGTYRIPTTTEETSSVASPLQPAKRKVIRAPVPTPSSS